MTNKRKNGKKNYFLFVPCSSPIIGCSRGTAFVLESPLMTAVYVHYYYVHIMKFWRHLPVLFIGSFNFVPVLLVLIWPSTWEHYGMDDSCVLFVCINSLCSLFPCTSNTWWCMKEQCMHHDSFFQFSFLLLFFILPLFPLDILTDRKSVV